MSVSLILLFLLIALIYSMVGFGGGSSYIALLILVGISHTIAPSVALICNIIVVTGGCYHYYKNKTLSFKFVFPFLLLSIPFSFLGGQIVIDKNVYQFILGLALLCAASRMLFFKAAQFNKDEFNHGPSFLIALIIGAGLGFLSGLLGIGGGIFLAPLLYLFKWGNPKRIAATASFFILLNSLAGLGGQVTKTGDLRFHITELLPFYPLILAVLIGGQIGSWISHARLSHRKIEVLTSFLILFVSFRLFINLV
jgi:uncharacterized protein